MKWWLVIGVPGSGKTTFGNYLKDNHNFMHFDFEISQDFQAFITNPDLFINQLKSNNKSIVITWGFVPDEGGLSLVQYLRNNGFNLIWFDGNRVASFKAFLKRGDVPEELYYLQMHRIENSKVVSKLNPTLINPFNEDHSFRNPQHIAEELNKLIDLI